MDRNAYLYQSTTTSFPGKNPYRRKKRVKDEDKIPENIKQKYAEKNLGLGFIRCRELPSGEEF